MSQLFDLTGKRALVTGASRGIGKALALGLADHGADLVLVARDQNKLGETEREIQKRSGRQVDTFPFDIANLERIYQQFEKIVSKVGSVDILLNAAGTAERGPSEDFPLAKWHEILQVNLSAVFVFCQAFCRHRKEQGGSGKIINIGSLMCHGARAYNPPYAASKGGLLLLTKELAVDWAKYHINVNIIGPGWYPTDMTAPIKDKLNDWILSRTPMARWGKLEDLVGTAVFLASGASDFITGQMIYVDGGWTAEM